MAGERHVEHRRTHAAVLNDVLHGRNQVTRPPSEGAAGLQDQAQVRIFRLELLQNADQLVAIVILVGHKVSAAHIEPFDPVEETTETLFDGIERQAQMFGAGLAQHVEMQSFHPGGQLLQLPGRNTQPRTGHARVIEIGFYRRIAGVDPQAARNTAQQGHLSEPFELRNGIEGDVIAAIENLFDIPVGIYRSVRMRRTAELLENQPRLGQRRSGGSVGMLRKLRENTPHGTGLQSDDHFGTALPANAVDDRQIPIEQLLIQHKAGRR